MVELALLLPILVFGLIGAADLARAFALQVAIQRAIDEMSRTPGMDINNPSLVVAAWALQSDGATACLQPPTVATPCFVTVSIQYTFRTLVAWPLIPNTANFNLSTTMRTFY